MRKKYQKSPRWIIWCIGGLILISLAGLIFWNYKNLTSSETNREVALTCTTDMATRFHIHFDLKIVINGQDQQMPANIGITGNCMNSLHTHNASGEIHVESPEKRDFTLSDFFAVWKKTYNKDQIIDYRVDENNTIKEAVNGKEVEDYENTILKDGDQIV